MRSYGAALLIGSTLLLGGCLEHILDDLEPWLDTASSSGSSSTTTTGVETTDAVPTGGVQTVTSATTMSTGPGPVETTSGADDPDGPPPSAGLSFDPPELTMPGASSAKFMFGETVTSAALSLDGKVIAQGPPDSLSYTFEATSEKLNGDYDFKLVVYDGKGGSAAALATLEIGLPEHGLVRCAFQDTPGIQHSAVASVAWTDDYIAALGVRDEGAGPRLVLWGIDPVTCGVLWWQKIDIWTQLPIDNLPSTGASLALDEQGNFVIAGNLFQNGKFRPYLALLRADDRSLIWETLGDPGDQAAGVARAPWPYENIIMVGSRLTSVNPPRYDMLVKGYTTGDSVWIDVLKAPFAVDELNNDEFNHYSERALAVDINPDTLEVIVVGEREFQPDFEPKFPWRTFTARYYPMGGRIGTWTSSGDYLPQDSARSLRRCGDGFVAGGWTSDYAQGSTRWPLVRRLDGQGVSIGRRSEPFADTETAGADCDREGKVVSASTRMIGNQTDIVLYAYILPEEPLVWQAKYAGQGMGDDKAATLACDEWGFCAWGGYELVDGKNRALVQIHYP
jgi:hypothetical protein